MFNSSSLFTYGVFPSRVTGTLPLPSAPTSLVGCGNGLDKIYLIWKWGSYTEYFSIYRSDTLSGSYSAIASNVFENQYLDSGLSNQFYYYKVVGLNSSGSSNFSNITSRKPDDSNSGYIDPLAITTYGYYCSITGSGSGGTGFLPAVRPSRLSLIRKDSSTITLNWRFGQYTQYFQVWRSLSPTGTYSIIANNVIDVFYDDKNLSNQQYYWYKVRGIDGSNQPTVFSNIVWGRPIQSIQTCNTPLPQVSVNNKLNRDQSLFFNDRQWQFVKHISKQFVGHVAKQQVYYYELDQRTTSGSVNIYGQTKKKIWKKPKRLYGRVKRNPVNSDRKQYGYRSSYSIQVYFDKNVLQCNGVDVNYMVGNQIQWDHKSFLIRDVQLFDSVMGLSDYKITVKVLAVYTQD